MIPGHDSGTSGNGTIQCGYKEVSLLYAYIADRSIRSDGLIMATSLRIGHVIILCTYQSRQ